jgi:uncharacterized membrane protein
MKNISLIAMVLLYVAAGINHFIHPELYLSIMPPWLPFHSALVDISGVCEILFGLLLILKRTRVVAAWLIIALLIAVFPANIQMFINYWRSDSPLLWIAIVRLPVQGLLIWWAYGFTKMPNTKTPVRTGRFKASLK